METLIVIKTVEELDQVKKVIADNEFIAFDIETTGLDKESKIIGFSIAASPETGFYVVLSEWIPSTSFSNPVNLDRQNSIFDSHLKDLATKDKAEEIIQSLVGKSLIMHNGVFDCSMVQNNYNIRLIDYLHTDTMILGHLLDENRLNGLKELGVSIYGEDAKAEQIAMKESVHKNGGQLTKDNYELYKADSNLLGKYGAKDAILTLKLFYLFVEELYAQGLDKFFYEDESMPLLRGPTYDLNTVGLKVDVDKLQKLKSELEADCLEAKAFIYKEIKNYVSEDYPGTNKRNTFNIGSGTQISWLLFHKLENEFFTLTNGGKELCKSLNIKFPYAPAHKREFIRTCVSYKGRVHEEIKFNNKTKKMQRAKKVKDYWNYLASDKNVLALFANKYKWVEKLLHLSKQETILDTYVIGIQNRIKYGIVKPSFLQHGTTSGRYSSKNPNFQNLPRKDKRIKACIISRPGKVFVGADYSQLEPRVFASMSQDETLMGSFAKGEDFYAVVGAPIHGITGISLIKDEKDPNCYAMKYPNFRDQDKIIALATPYGRTASFTASQMGVKREEAQELMDKYFEAYPKVELMMLESHEQAKKNGIVYNLFGRPRRIPEAKSISKLYGKVAHNEMPYEARTLLNLGMNHRIQSTGASIMNRAAIKFYSLCKEVQIEAKIVLQVHDQLIAECDEEDSESVCLLLKESMENTVTLPGVALIAEPFISKDLAGQK